MRLLSPAIAALPLLFTTTNAFAYGEPASDGVPNNEERLLHVFTNQVRQDPYAWSGWNNALATGEARGPLFMQSGLEEAARFHADDMAEHQCFQHESCDGTTFPARITRYFQGPAGENIFMGFGYGASAAITAWMNSDGHRVNILDGRFNRLGAGFSDAANNHYYVQDFGIETTNARQAIPAAAFEAMGGGKIRLLANHAGSANVAPTSFVAVLGAKTIPLEHLTGPEGNSTYQAIGDDPGACTALYFVADGTKFPTTGALLAGSACTESFQSENPMNPDDRPVINADDRNAGCTCVLGFASPLASAFVALAFFVLVFAKKIA